MKLQNAINNIPVIQSNGSVQFNLPIGVRYHALNFFLSSGGARVAVTTSNFSRMRITIDSVVLVDADWPTLQLRALRRGISLATGQIPVLFSDPLLAGQRNANCGSIDTKQGITNIQVYIQLGTITSPSITGEMIFDNAPNVRPEIVNGKRTGNLMAYNTPIMISTQVENIPINSNYDITDIPAAYPLDTITLYNNADFNISYIRLFLNKVLIFDGIPSDLAREFLSYGIYTPPGSIVLPFTYDRFAPTSAAGFSSIDIYVNCSVAFACGVALEVQLPSIT